MLLFALPSRVRAADANHNGIDDAWELAHFGDLTHRDPAEDLDGDGASNIEEFRLGTDPTDRFDSPAARRQANPGCAFSFSLAAECDTSAGVYAAIDDREYLVRTLWRGVRYQPGAHKAHWDGLDERGHRTVAGEYQVKVQGSNLSYVWDGVIGNSSAAFTGVVHQAGSGYGIADLASDGRGTFYAAYGYNEGQADVRAIHAADPQRPVNVIANTVFTAWGLVAADGPVLYLASIGDVGHDPQHTTFVRKCNPARPEDAVAGFGRPVSFPTGPTFPSCTDVQENGPRSTTWSPATGLAVQAGERGSVLAVAHGDSLQRSGPVAGQNVIRLFNKGSGEPAGAIGVSNPQRLAFGPDGDLWAIVGKGTAQSPRSVVRFAAESLGMTSVPGGGALSGLSHPLAIAVSPDGSTVAVADGGDAQTVRAFSTATMHPLWQYGQPGGYQAHGPDVTGDKFQFGESVPLAFAPDGTFWVGDGSPGRGGTGRLLHVSPISGLLEEISYLTANSTVACDPNDSSRVFWDFLEYHVDYTKPLLPGSGGGGSWKLVKNWAAGLNPRYYPWRGAGFGLNTVVTLMRDGHTSTYGLANEGGPVSTNTLFELPASGLLRSTGQHWPAEYRGNGGSYSLCADGDIRYSTWAEGRQRIWRLPLGGIDAKGNPKWDRDAPVLLATNATYAKALANGTGNFGTSPQQYPVTDGGVVVTFDSAQGPAASRGMRLGGSAVGGAGYLWEASPTVQSDVPFDGLGSYDLGDGIESYGGDKVMSVGRHIVYGFAGEMYNGTEANQFMHFSDDGLFVGQFGTPGKVLNEAGPAIAGFAGNSFCPALVRDPASGEVYLYHNDESNHAGIHRWHLVGANAVFALRGTVRSGASVALKAEAAAAPTGLRATGGNALAWTPVAGAVGYRVKVSAGRGGPYTATYDCAGTHFTPPTLTAGGLNYCAVSAVNTAGKESPNSDEVKLFPAPDAGAVVQVVGQLVYFGWESLRVDSRARARGGFPLQISKTLDNLGALLRANLGSRGYAVFGQRTESHLAEGFAVSRSWNWTSEANLDNTFLVDSTPASRAGLSASEDAPSTVDVSAPDARWHTLTVFCPAVTDNPQHASVMLAPQGATSGGARMEIRDPVQGKPFGFNRALQFRFKGCVTLTFTFEGTPGSGYPAERPAALQAIFLDDAPELEP